MSKISDFIILKVKPLVLILFDDILHLIDVLAVGEMVIIV